MCTGLGSFSKNVQCKKKSHQYFFGCENALINKLYSNIKKREAGETNKPKLGES